MKDDWTITYLPSKNEGRTAPVVCSLADTPPLLKDSKILQCAMSDGMPVGELRHGELHRILTGHGDTVTRMLLEYLEDVGMKADPRPLRKNRRYAFRSP